MPNTRVQDRPLRVGVFSTIDEASRAVSGLLDAGFSNDQISVVCSDQAKERHFRLFEHQEPAGTTSSAAAITGGALGAVAGGLGVVLTAAATGGVALWTAGPISAWAGGIVGGLVGAMMSRGVEKELANFYQQSVNEGDILVAAEDEGPNQKVNLAKAAKVFASAGAKPLPLPEG